MISFKKTLVSPCYFHSICLFLSAFAQKCAARHKIQEALWARSLLYPWCPHIATTRSASAPLLAARRTFMLFSSALYTKKHRSAMRSKQRRACAACSRYVGKSRYWSKLLPHVTLQRNDTVQTETGWHITIEWWNWNFGLINRHIYWLGGVVFSKRDSSSTIWWVNAVI